MDELQRAAEVRREAVAQRSHRPRDRRSTQSAGPHERGRVSYESSLSLRTSGDGGKVSFLGIASAYEKPYEMFDAFGPYQEVVSHGAAAKSLAQTGLDVPLVLGHDSMKRIARTTNGTLTLRETSAGLEVNAPDLNPDDADVKYIVPKLEAGLIDEMSFAFRIVSGQWSPDYTEYRISEFDLHRGDVSIVGYGANPYTSAELRAQSGEDLISVDETRLLMLPY